MISRIVRPLTVIFACLFLAPEIGAQQSFEFTPDLSLRNLKKYSLTSFDRNDSQKVTSRRTETQKANIGGLFISPAFGVSFPTGQFGELSNSGFFYSFKLEAGFSKLYPFVIGLIYENHTNPGNPEFTTANFLTQFETDITYYGGSVDIILNKYLRSNFTIPVLSLEFKMADIKRSVTPNNVVPEIPREESTFTYAAGMAFTLYVLDIGGKYTFAGDFSNLTFFARIHLPLIKF